MSEEVFVHYCSPTLAGIKTANLFSCRFADEKEMRDSVRRLNVEPAWLTMIIFAFQGMWSMTGGNFIYKEELKMLPTALAQIQSGGIARAGVAAAANLLMFIPPVIMFLVTQSSIMETMAHAGIKE